MLNVQYIDIIQIFRNKLLFMYSADVCTFESNFCDWTNSHNDQTNWRRHSGSTPSSNTGPSADAHGSKSGKQPSHQHNDK